MKYLGRYISRLLGRSLTRAFITFPSCAIDYAVAWYKNLNARFKTCEVPDIIEGLLDFDGSNDSVSFSSSPDISGSKVITFKMYFSSGTANGAVLLLTNGVSNDCLYIYRSNTVISLFCKRGSSGTNCKGVTGSLASYLSTVMSFVVTKDTEEIISLSINGDNIPLTLSGDFFSNSGEVFTVGAFSSVSEIENTLIWNLNIGGTSAYLGQPNGNQNSAWVDTIGSINGVVNGSPTTTSIDLGGNKTVYCIDDVIGTRDDTVFFGQYLTNASGQINLYRTTGTFDYTDPSDGSLVENVVIPGTGLYTIPANGICNIGVYPREGDINGLMYFDGVDDYVQLDGVPDVTGDKTISFNFRIDTVPSIAGYLIQFGTGTTDYISIAYSSGKLTVQCSAGDVGSVDLDIIIGTVYNIVINKTLGTTQSIFLNSVSQTVGGSVINIPVTTGDTIGNLEGSSRYFNGLLWGLNINNTHQYLGLPDGNLDSAWVDQIIVNVPVPNAGATGTTDWINPTDGLADGWQKSNSLFSTSLVSGNGFNNTAQRITAVDTNNYYIFSGFFNVNIGADYTFSCKYRTNDTTTGGSSSQISIVEGIGTPLKGFEFDLNIGNAVKKSSSSFTATSSSLWCIIRAGDTIGNYVEIDEIMLTEDSALNGTVNGSPLTTNISTTGVWDYVAFYPVCERAGTVLHDVMQDSIHISVVTPTWDETLYGSDYLNQYGYVNKTDFDALGYDWETDINGTPITLNDDTLVPLAQWVPVNLIDSLSINILDSDLIQITVKQNI